MTTFEAKIKSCTDHIVFSIEKVDGIDTSGSNLVVFYPKSNTIRINSNIDPRIGVKKVIVADENLLILDNSLQVIREGKTV